MQTNIGKCSLFSDGSSGYSQYRYKGAPGQNNLLVSTLTILRLVVEYQDLSTGQYERSILWENMMPNSPYAISPLRMKFEEETTGTLIYHGNGTSAKLIIIALLVNRQCFLTGSKDKVLVY